MSVLFVALINPVELVLAQQSLQLSFIGTVRLFRGTTFIGVRGTGTFTVFGKFVFFDLKILLSVVEILVDILDTSFLFEVGVNDAIVLIEFLLFLFFFEFFDAFDQKFVERDIEV